MPTSRTFENLTIQTCSLETRSLGVFGVLGLCASAGFNPLISLWKDCRSFGLTPPPPTLPPIIAGSTKAEPIGEADKRLLLLEREMSSRGCLIVYLRALILPPRTRLKKRQVMANIEHGSTKGKLAFWLIHSGLALA